MVQIVLGLAYIVAGIVLVLNPTFGMASLALVVAVYLVIKGLIEISMSLNVRENNHWAMAFLGGVFAIILGGLVLLSWPTDAQWFVGLAFGVGLALSGLAMVFLGLQREEERPSEMAPPA